MTDYVIPIKNGVTVNRVGPSAWANTIAMNHKRKIRNKRDFFIA